MEALKTSLNQAKITKVAYDVENNSYMITIGFGYDDGGNFVNVTSKLLQVDGANVQNGVDLDAFLPALKSANILA